MDSLRWILLLTGVLIFGLIYFFAIFQAKKKQVKRPSEIIFNQDLTSDIHISPISESDAEFPELRTEHTTAIDEEEIPTLEEPVVSGFQPEISDAENKQADVPPPDDLIYLRIVATDTMEFKGLRILIATKNSDMKFGKMNIFHHYGVGDLKTSKPIFSLANIYEPGEFNLQEMESFSTRGLVLYMSVPTELEAGMCFELMLNTAQRIAEELGGEVRDAGNQKLNEDNIRRLREKVKAITIAG